VFGRYVKGTAINAPIETVDPSVDTRHCVITVRKKKQGAYRFILRDDNSTTGTFYMSELLGPKETVNMEDGGIITIGATTMIFREKKEEEEE
jgi:pSer/pThr/pTyr-binding forkhead associated (FHA) protein